MTKILRHPKTNVPIIGSSISVDDFGNEIWLCPYTKNLVTIGKHIFIGPCMPQVNGTYVCAPDAMPAYKESKAAFNEMDANCNTCANLERVKHEKKRGGFLLGKCKKTEQNIRFHPDDWMGMECWIGRE